MDNSVKKNYDISIIGGDKRLVHMASILTEKGYRVICYAVWEYGDDQETERFYTNAASMAEAVQSADIIIGGIPFVKGDTLFSLNQSADLSISRFYSCLRKGQKLFAGVLSEDFRKQCEEKGVCCYDFMKDESITVFNTVATAEGAILEALRNQETNIHGSKTLVMGYGRCGKVLCDKLKGLSAEVTVCCRNEQQLVMAAAFGMKTLPFQQLQEEISRYEYIYNTIPSVILHKDILKNMKKEAIIIDIASGAGGVDYAAAEKYGVRALLCPGLPGKYAPKVSAYNLADYVCRLLV